jgi:formylglycine-generating enzyme required for sulfatase activity
MTEILSISEPISLHLVRIPAGEFLMGSVMARDKGARENELPPHRVHLPEFHIGQYPVTNFQYWAFVRATGHGAPDHWEKGRIPWRKDDHPVVNLSWYGAAAFCDWLSRHTGQPFRLPTEAEWEKAARGSDGRIYPWGDDPPDEARCNFGNRVADTTTIGRYSPQGDSPYGCADIAGNVWEWCQSKDWPYPYQADDGRENLQLGGLRVVRGGSWYDRPAFVRCACRHTILPSDWSNDLGFRVCVVARQD